MAGRPLPASTCKAANTLQHAFQRRHFWAQFPLQINQLVRTVPIIRRVTLSLVVLALLFGGARKGRADLIALNPADTYITEHASLGGSDSNHAGDALLYSIRGTGSFVSFPLIRFDLTSLAGMIVTGPATLQLFTDTGFPQDSPRLESVHQILINYNASTVTFNNFSPLGPGVHFDSDVGAALDTQSFILNSANPARDITWIISAAVLQQWIDDPASNNGLLMNNQITANAFDVTFNSVENSNSPILSFQTQAVPEPSTLAMLALGAIRLLAYLRGSGNELRSAADSGHPAGTTATATRL